MALIVDANLHEFLDDWLASELPAVTDKLKSRQEEEEESEGINCFFGTGCHEDSISPMDSYNHHLQQQEQHLHRQQQKLVVVADHEKNGTSQLSINSCNSPVVATPPPPLPIGLNLTITQSFMDKLLPFVGQNSADSNGKGSCSGMITTAASIADHHDEPPIICSSQEKKKRAVNFPISTIQIGGWKRNSRHEGDVVAKCYYQKQKLVWEALDGNLKAKIEFPWSDIIAIRPTLFPNKPGVLELMLNKIPLFFREINPMPRKHTNWKASSDFTNGQATLVRKHILKFAPGVLDKHYENLIRSDESLHTLSSRPFPDHASPYFYVPVIHFSPPPPPPHHATSLSHYSTYPNCPQYPNNYSTARLMDGTVDRNIYGNGYGVVVDRSRMRVYPAAVEGCQISNGHQVDMSGNNHHDQRQQWMISNHHHHHHHHQDLSDFQQGVLRGREGGVPVTKQQLIDDRNRVCSHDYYPTDQLPTPNAATWLNQTISPSPSITMGTNIANQRLKQLEQIQQGFNGNYVHDNNRSHMAPVVDHNNMLSLDAVNNGMSTLDSVLQQQPTFVNYTCQNFEPSSTAWMMGSVQQTGSPSVMIHMSPPPSVFEPSLGLYEYCA